MIKTVSSNDMSDKRADFINLLKRISVFYIMMVVIIADLALIGLSLNWGKICAV